MTASIINLNRNKTEIDPRGKDSTLMYYLEPDIVVLCTLTFAPEVCTDGSAPVHQRFAPVHLRLAHIQFAPMVCT